MKGGNSPSPYINLT